MTSKYADGLTHGHCRRCDASCVLLDEWQDRRTGEVECVAAPGYPHWPWRWPEPAPLPVDPEQVGGPGGRWVDPGSLTFHHHNFNEAAVEFYRAHPDGRFDSSSGQPVISGGVLYNGVHRAEAARRVGRKLWIPDPSTLVRGRDHD